MCVEYTSRRREIKASLLAFERFANGQEMALNRQILKMIKISILTAKYATNQLKYNKFF
jgi:hypothetical protein